MDQSSRVVVDTDILIDYFAGISPATEAVERLFREDRLALTTLTLFELSCGAQTQEQRQDLEWIIQAAQLIPLDAVASIQAGAIYRQLKSKGQLLEPTDLLIAASCVAVGLPLLTRNVRHFRRVTELALLEARSLLETG